MPSLLKMFKPRSETRHESNNEKDTSKYARAGKDRGHSCARTRTVQSTAYSAACRGLYATPTNQSTKQQRTKSQLSRVHEDNDPKDPIIKHSMYPQMNGKRRSELEVQVRTRTRRYDRMLRDEQRRDNTVRVNRKTCRSHTMRRVRLHSACHDTTSDSDSDYSSDGSPEGRPDRVWIYPQAKYIKEPVKTPFDPQRALEGYSSDSSPADPAPRTPSFRHWKRSHLPGDEYQILRRRQVMQRAREVLEPHYGHRGSVKVGFIGHGQMQSFTEYHTERRRISRMNYAVRRALQADLKLFSDNFILAVTRHAESLRFCELSDVDGIPIDEKMIYEFIKMYRRALDEAYEPKDSKARVTQHNKPAQRILIGERNDQKRQATLRRADSGATVHAPVQRPALFSRFSWDSSDGEAETRKRLTKATR